MGKLRLESNCLCWDVILSGKNLSGNEEMRQAVEDELVWLLNKMVERLLEQSLSLPLMITIDVETSCWDSTLTATAVWEGENLLSGFGLSNET